MKGKDRKRFRWTFIHLSNLIFAVYQLIRMTDFFLGSKVFRERIKTYVDTFEFTHSDLAQVWEAFGTTPIIKKDNDMSESFSVQEVLETWLSRRGVPLIDVKQDYDTKYITVTQVCNSE